MEQRQGVLRHSRWTLLLQRGVHGASRRNTYRGDGLGRPGTHTPGVGPDAAVSAPGYGGWGLWFFNWFDLPPWCLQ